jgi:NAD(P)-dependent dehydrogenase (short-subunit alcohol dehydrogenase family)
MGNDRLKDKVAIITGGSSGIGLATTLRFLDEGANVVTADVVTADLNDARRDNGSKPANGRAAFFMQTDVSLESQVYELMRQTIARYGRIDVLVNNAGIELAKKGTDTTEDEWDRLMGVNLKGVFLCSKAAVSEMRRTGGGLIVNVASELGLVGGTEIAAYCASKGGVIQLTKAMAIDHAADNIRINCICPGPINTPLLHRIIESSAFPESERQITREKTLLKRLGEPAEIANVILFLASEESSYMTGSVVVVDGGLTAQ